jgi:ethanolamine utilization cobalamin adenosyltransferase
LSDHDPGERRNKTGKEIETMGLLTEADVRIALKNRDPLSAKEFHVERGTLITPAAREYLRDHNVTPIIGNDASNAASVDSKPEHMTSIKGTALVNKDHPIIRFRGKIDSMTARILEVQCAFEKKEMFEIVAELGEILAYVREILRCEVLDLELNEKTLLGMSGDELRERSHHPKKYFGINHFSPVLEKGEGVILLNTLRTQVREVELAAYDAFKDEYGVPKRTDIIRGLNRLSSLFYIMMFRVLTGVYE